MATAVEICNLALSHFGEAKINTLSAEAAEDNENVAKCLVYYDQARREVLERQPWTFARKRAALSRLSTSPAFDWDYQHQLPTDLLRVLEVRAGAENSTTGTVTYNTKLDAFEIAGRYVLSDSSLVAVRYVYDAEAQNWTRLAASALARLLAAYLAEAITGDPKRADYHRRIFEEVDLPTAQHHDAVQDQSNENHPLMGRLRRSLLVGARGSGVGDLSGESTSTGSSIPVPDELDVVDDW